MGFAVDIQPPDVARETWTAGTTTPTSTVLSEDGAAVGACVVQPRNPLPDGAFVPSILTGLLPLEGQLNSVSGVGEPAAEALFLDPDSTDARSFSAPYGVALLFTERGRSVADRFREQYDGERRRDPTSTLTHCERPDRDAAVERARSDYPRIVRRDKRVKPGGTPATAAHSCTGSSPGNPPGRR